jgi:hypothetical protein
MADKPVERPAPRVQSVETVPSLDVREDRKVIWWWNTKWMTLMGRGFIEVQVSSFQIDRVLVAVGLVDSRGAARRLVKQKGVSWRRDDNQMDWAKVADFRQEIEPGWPVVLRVGGGHWRILQVETEVTENLPVKKATTPKAFPGLALVMRPLWVEGLEEDGVTPWRNVQTMEFWSDMWR